MNGLKVELFLNYLTKVRSIIATDQRFHYHWYTIADYSLGFVCDILNSKAG